MIILRNLFVSVVLLVVGASGSIADIARVRTVPDGQISFGVSLSGPTRVSVVGDRIAKVLQSESAFEMVNDEGTGDIFLRYGGGGGRVGPESGYIVTESGVTIGFTMTPQTDISIHTVLVTITGRSTGTSQSSQAKFAVNAAPRATAAAAGQVSASVPASRTDKLVQFIRSVHAARIGDRSPANLRSGHHYSYSSGGLRGRVAVSTVTGNVPPHPRAFSNRPNVTAVWVDDQVYNGKVWVIFVEGTL